MDLAGLILSQLMGISAETGLSAATFFSQKLESDPDMFARVMQIRSEIQGGKDNAAMVLLLECFNIAGLNAMQALENMRYLA